MSDPIDLKTAKIFTDLNKKLDKDYSSSLSFNNEEVHEALEKQSHIYFRAWIKLQQSWSNNAYRAFQDYDTYVILIFLVLQVFKKYSDRFQYLSEEEFYSREHKLDKINLIEISKELNIPKETIRRKVNFLQKKNLLIRRGKSIFLTKEISIYQRPNSTKTILATFLEKNSILLSKEDWFGEHMQAEKIVTFISKFFTIAWQHWFRLQIPFLIRHRNMFGDLETWNVWGSIGISQFHDYNKSVADQIIPSPERYKDLYIQLLKHKPKNGINASSVAEISGIPRATVIRKLKFLVKEKFIKKNKKLEYTFVHTNKQTEFIEKAYLVNKQYVSNFITDIFDLMKNSKFKI